VGLPNAAGRRHPGRQGLRHAFSRPTVGRCVPLTIPHGNTSVLDGHRRRRRAMGTAYFAGRSSHHHCRPDGGQGGAATRRRPSSSGRGSTPETRARPEGAQRASSWSRVPRHRCQPHVPRSEAAATTSCTPPINSSQLRTSNFLLIWLIVGKLPIQQTVEPFCFIHQGNCTAH
jgi:hypothetical protein